MDHIVEFRMVSEPVARVAVEQTRGLDVWLIVGSEEVGTRGLREEVVEMFACGAHDLLIEEAEVIHDVELEFVRKSGECER